MTNLILKQKTNSFLHIIILIGLAFIIQACQVDLHLDEHPEKASFNYSRIFPGDIDINIQNCKPFHQIRCEANGLIDSYYYRYDPSGREYPVDFKLKDEDYCSTSHHLDLSIPIICGAEEVVSARISCFDDSRGGMPIETSQSDFIKFACR